MSFFPERFFHYFFLHIELWMDGTSFSNPRSILEKIFGRVEKAERERKKILPTLLSAPMEEISTFNDGWRKFSYKQDVKEVQIAVVIVKKATIFKTLLIIFLFPSPLLYGFFSFLP